MGRKISFVLLILLAAALLGAPNLAFAQESQPTPEPPSLLIYTSFPNQEIGLGESITLSLRIRLRGEPQVVNLSVGDAPEGWNISLRGGGRTVNAVFADITNDASVDLRVEPPANPQPGIYKMSVSAIAGNLKSTLPLEFTVKEKTPPRLVLEIDLPTQRGGPDTTFRYSVRLMNEGDDQLDVNLFAEAPQEFLSRFELSGQEVTNVPLNARETKNISFSAEPLTDLQVGSYPFKIQATGGEVSASLDLTAEVAGRPSLVVTSPDGRLSAQANAGSETPIKVVIQNTGSAPAQGVDFSSTEPSGWTVTFEPEQVVEIPAGEQVEITAKVRPAEKAVAGDYVMTIRAQPAEGAAKQAEFRITVLTSTLWGVVGVILIAIAVGVVGLAVARFGRR